MSRPSAPREPLPSVPSTPTFAGTPLPHSSSSSPQLSHSPSQPSGALRRSASSSGMVNHLFDIVENPSLTRQQKRDAIVQLCDMANKSPKVLASQAIIETAIDWLKSEDNAAVFEYAQFVIETMAVVDKGVFLTCFQFTNNAKPAELAKLTQENAISFLRMGGCILRGYNGIAFSLCGLSNVPNPAMANKPPVPDMVVSVRQSYINDAVKLMSRSIQLCLSSPVVIQLHLELVVFLLENPDLRPDSASLIGFLVDTIGRLSKAEHAKTARTIVRLAKTLVEGQPELQELLLDTMFSLMIQNENIFSITSALLPCLPDSLTARVLPWVQQRRTTPQALSRVLGILLDWTFSPTAQSIGPWVVALVKALVACNLKDVILNEMTPARIEKFGHHLVKLTESEIQQGSRNGNGGGKLFFEWTTITILPGSPNADVLMVVFCLLLGNADIRVAQLIMPPLFAFLRKCSAISQGKPQQGAAAATTGSLASAPNVKSGHLYMHKLRHSEMFHAIHALVLSLHYLNGAAFLKQVDQARSVLFVAEELGMVPLPSTKIKEALTRYAWIIVAPLPSPIVRSASALLISASSKVPIGLDNLGNTCFLNSVIQALFANVSFRAAIFRNGPAPKAEMFAALQMLFGYMAFSSRPYLENVPVGPNPLVNTIQSLNEDLRTGLQQDAMECLQSILAMIEPDLMLSKENNLLRKVFGGEQYKIIECVAKHKVLKKEIYTDLSLYFNDAMKTSTTPVKLEDLVKSLWTPEELKGSDQFRCEKCNRLTDASKHGGVEVPSNNLIVHLCRFEYDKVAHRRKKIGTAVVVPEHLSILALKDKQDKSGKSEYRLHSVIMHAGFSADSGHYYCYARSTEDANSPWFLFNDDNVQQIGVWNDVQDQFQHAMTATPYILFYQRIDVPLDFVQFTPNILPSGLYQQILQDNATKSLGHKSATIAAGNGLGPQPPSYPPPKNAF